MSRSKFTLITASVLLLIFDRLEYLWIHFDGWDIYYKVPFIHEGAPIRLDGWVYLICVRLKGIVYVVTLHLLFPMSRYTRWVIAAFVLSLIELPLTYNEPVFKIQLPVFGWYIPGSVATLQFASVCYFMYGCVKKTIDEP